jgi:alkylation response protein AidB-like acyl-CoA dehydrogenase
MDFARMHEVLRGLLRERSADQAATVMGAGSDDLESGRAYLEALAPHGWAVPEWPTEYGGLGASAGEAAAIEKELERYEAPDLYPFLVALHVVAPTLLAEATPEQCARWLPRIASGADIWTQLFSEPGAGSDLANLGARAVRDADGNWRVTGQKVWGSRAHYAQWGFLLARTDPDVQKHAGISAFAVRMDSPGLEVRPLLQMNGDAHFSEVFLDDVLVLDSDRIGEVGAGWKVTRTALAAERLGIGGAGAGGSGLDERLLDLARARLATLSPTDHVRRDEVVRVWVETEVARLTSQRAADAAAAGKRAGPEGSGDKLRRTAGIKSTAQAALGLLGVDGIVGEGEWQTLFLMAPSMSIRGGTDEIQKNILGEGVLGLAPEPKVDRDKPWSQIPH